MNIAPPANALAKAFLESSRRVRFTYLVINITAIILLIGFFNYRGTWLEVVQYNFEKSNLDKNITEADLLKSDWQKKISKSDTSVQQLRDLIIKAFDNHSVMDSSLRSTITNYLNDFDKKFIKTRPDIATLIIAESVKRMAAANDWRANKSLYHDFKEVELKKIDVPILGIDIYIQDVPLLGGIAVLAMFAWHFFSLRRQRGIIIAIKKHINNSVNNQEEKEFLLNTIEYNRIFNVVPGIDNVSEVVDDKEKLYAIYKPSRIEKVFIHVEEIIKIDNIIYRLQKMGFRFIRKLPIFIIILIVSVDYYETYHKPKSALFELLEKDNLDHLLNPLTRDNKKCTLKEYVDVRENTDFFDDLGENRLWFPIRWDFRITLSISILIILLSLLVSRGISRTIYQLNYQVSLIRERVTNPTII